MPKLQNRRGGTAGLSAEERDFRLEEETGEQQQQQQSEEKESE
eukprot:CAMPEP_0206505358 /NCGR_PEP_ID=MMETSP0324_2-20121206/56078_1 /ASSEMBLY_ACC=CAM_ASM_000836 /TAXON_ID=2866 /ORGANISM="Crypthecodinium cohnii, Strain Seligo" /LENGTH=42 /DNA_ID= /DNA_START= /DNA_END= /DNA_ORIENTATION=